MAKKWIKESSEGSFKIACQKKEKKDSVQLLLSGNELVMKSILTSFQNEPFSCLAYCFKNFNHPKIENFVMN